MFPTITDEATSLPESCATFDRTWTPTTGNRVFAIHDTLSHRAWEREPRAIIAPDGRPRTIWKRYDGAGTEEGKVDAAARKQHIGGSRSPTKVVKKICLGANNGGETLQEAVPSLWDKKSRRLPHKLRSEQGITDDKVTDEEEQLEDLNCNSLSYADPASKATLYVTEFDPGPGLAEIDKAQPNQEIDSSQEAVDLTGPTIPSKSLPPQTEDPCPIFRTVTYDVSDLSQDHGSVETLLEDSNPNFVLSTTTREDLEEASSVEGVSLATDSVEPVAELIGGDKHIQVGEGECEDSLEVLQDQEATNHDPAEADSGLAIAEQRPTVLELSVAAPIIHEPPLSMESASSEMLSLTLNAPTIKDVFDAVSQGQIVDDIQQVHASSEDTSARQEAQNEETDLLLDFLRRANATKAARIAEISAASHRRDSGVIKLALASPRKALDEMDTNSPSPRKNGAEEVLFVLKSNGSPPASPLVSLKESKPTEDNSEITPTEVNAALRRSARSRMSKPSSEITSAENISVLTIRRPEEQDRVLFKRSDAQELATTTRTNTRRNKGSSLSVRLMLMKLGKETSTPSSPQPVTEFQRVTKTRKGGITWPADDALCHFFVEKVESELSLGTARRSNQQTGEHLKDFKVIRAKLPRANKTVAAMNSTANPDSPSNVVQVPTASTTPVTALGAKTTDDTGGVPLPPVHEQVNDEAASHQQQPRKPTSTPRRPRQQRRLPVPAKANSQLRSALPVLAASASTQQTSCIPLEPQPLPTPVQSERTHGAGDSGDKARLAQPTPLAHEAQSTQAAQTSQATQATGGGMPSKRRSLMPRSRTGKRPQAT